MKKTQLTCNRDLGVHVLILLYSPETNCGAERASELGSDAQRDEGEAGAAVAPDLAGTLSL